MPTFRSSIADEVVLIDRDTAGNQRVLRAINDGGNNTRRGQWRCHIEEPTDRGGVVRKECGTVYGGRGEAAVGLADLLNRTESDWKQSRARGFKPPEPTLRDQSMRIDDGGNVIGGAQVHSPHER